jgi:peroxiredoxin
MSKLSKRFSLLVLTILMFGFINESTHSINDFSLKNIDGKMVSLSQFKDAKGFIIVFTCNHCPFAKLYPERFNQLNLKYKGLGVPLIAISSTDTIMYAEDTYPKMVKKAKKEKFNFPYLFDGAQTVAKDFTAQKTPHAYVVWKVNGKWLVKYDGAIDDNGNNPEKVSKHYVADAVDSLLVNKPVAICQTKSIGCQIIFR